MSINKARTLQTSIAEYLQVLYEPYTERRDQYVEVRALVPKWHADSGKMLYREWFQITDKGYDKLQTEVWRLMSDRECDIYYSFLPRQQGKGDGAAVSQAAWIYTGIDGELAGLSGARKLLAQSVKYGRVPSPSIVINSGHGLHCYWPLPEVISFDTNQSRDTFNSILQGVAQSIGLPSKQELATKIIKEPHADAARLPSTPRLPGTINYKDRDVPVGVGLERLDLNKVRWPYDLWKRKIPLAPRETASNNYSVGTDRPLPKSLELLLHTPAAQGTRHVAWSKFCASARMSGFGEQALEMAGAQFCSLNPGFTQREMKETVRWALRNVASKENCRR